MMRVAVVGSGYRGKNLARNFHALGALAAVCDRDVWVLQAFQTIQDGVPSIQNFDDLLGESIPSKAIVIATATENGTQRENNIST